MILDEIAKKTRVRVEEQKKRVPLEKLRAQAESLTPDTGLPFTRMLEAPGIHYICEVKKASPSRGVIAEEFPYLDIAREYEDAGAGAVSCLTEPYWFQGSDRYLVNIVRELSIPVLRKDFTVDEYMIYEAKVMGASAVLLIAALLDTETMAWYLKLCDRLGLSALTEVHDEEEMESALKAGAKIIGVNNRNLRDFTVDVGNSIRLRHLAPENVLFVAESGIRTPEDIQALREAKVNGVLIGETLMRSPDKGRMLSRLNGGPVRKGAAQ